MTRASWGSKRLKSKGAWELRYTVAGKRKSSIFRGSAKEADRELSVLRMKYEGLESGNCTVGEFWAAVFLPECQKRVSGELSDSMSPRTLRGYVSQYDATIANR